MFLFTVVPVATSVSADETEALKAEITKAVEKVQEAGANSLISHTHTRLLNFTEMYRFSFYFCPFDEGNG